MSLTAAFADVSAPVNRIIRFSCVDGPGNRTSVFLQECPFACTYCHNPETIRACINCGKCVSLCPAGALRMISGHVEWDEAKCCFCDTCIKSCEHLSSPRIKVMTAAQVFEEIRENMPFIRGVTVSGGECTVHRDFCLVLAQLCHNEKLNFLLDSNGSLLFENDPALTESIDGVMLDVKAWNESEHSRLTGHSNASVLANLEFLARAGKLEEVRTVVVPDMMNAEETVSKVSKVLTRLAPETRYKLISYRPMGVREPYRSKFTPPDAGFMQSLEALAHRLGIKNTVLL